MSVRNPGPTWLWLFADVWTAVLVCPAIGCGYLLATGRRAVGIGVLVAWIAVLWVVASAMDRRGYARRWIVLTGGLSVFAVSFLAFTWLAQ